MNKDVYLVCGVPGSGKTWVCEQLRNQFHYVPHDAHLGTLPLILGKVSEATEKPMLTECPFGERPLKEKLEALGLKVHPYFVVESVNIVADRYFKRSGKRLPQASVTRATSIKNRVDEWKAPHGTSQQVLDMLREVK